jgi:DNA-binding PadR family transcriptional regulator
MYGRGMSPEMREPTYFLLVALLDGPRHGYAIAQAAMELSEGRVRLTAGTLYGALDRLVSAGLIAEHGEEVVSGRRRRSYVLTEDGRTALRREAQRLRAAASVVERRLGTVGA